RQSVGDVAGSGEWGGKLVSLLFSAKRGDMWCRCAPPRPRSHKRADHAGWLRRTKGVAAVSLRNLAEIGIQPVDGTRRDLRCRWLAGAECPGDCARWPVPTF